MHHRDELLPDRTYSHAELHEPESNWVSSELRDTAEIHRHICHCTVCLLQHERLLGGYLPVVLGRLEGEVNSVVTEMALEGRSGEYWIFFMTAFARWRTWCQNFIVRCRYWICIVGQGIRRANGHSRARVEISNWGLVSDSLIPRRQAPIQLF